jgi:hypothetical protein
MGLTPTYSGLLKQPDKQKSANRNPTRSVAVFSGLVV